MKAAASKAVVRFHRTVGSNPTLSAIFFAGMGIVRTGGCRVRIRIVTIGHDAFLNQKLDETPWKLRDTRQCRCGIRPSRHFCHYSPSGARQMFIPTNFFSWCANREILFFCSRSGFRLLVKQCQSQFRKIASNPSRDQEVCSSIVRVTANVRRVSGWTGAGR